MIVRFSAFDRDAILALQDRENSRLDYWFEYDFLYWDHEYPIALRLECPGNYQQLLRCRTHKWYRPQLGLKADVSEFDEQLWVAASRQLSGWVGFHKREIPRLLEQFAKRELAKEQESLG